MSRALMHTSEPFHREKGVCKTTRSKYDTISLMCEPFDEIFYCTPHIDGNPDGLQLHALPDKYRCISTGNRRKDGKVRRVLHMTLEAILFPFRCRRADIAYARLPMWDAYLPALLAAVFAPRRAVSLHGDIEEVLDLALKEKPRWFRRFMVRSVGGLTRFIAARAHVLFTSGPALGEKYAPQRTDIVPFLDSGYLQEDIFRRESVCESSETRLLYVGELVERKGISYLLRATAMLKERGRRVVLRLVGAGDDQRYRREAEELGISDLVDFAGRVPYGPALFSEYRKADIFVLPSIGTEGWSRVIIEANANGVPVVATDTGSLGHAVRECNCGLAAEPASASSLAECIERIMTDDQLRRRLLKGAADRAELHSVERELARVWTALHEAFPAVVRPAPTDAESLMPSLRLTGEGDVA